MNIRNVDSISLPITNLPITIFLQSSFSSLGTSENKLHTKFASCESHSGRAEGCGWGGGGGADHWT